MSNKLVYSMLVLLIVVVGFLFITNQSIFMNKEAKIESTINISSQKEMEFEPDSANISLGVETRSEDLADAKNKNNQKMNNIKQSLAEYQEIEFSNVSFNVYPVYENNEKKQKSIKYYRVRNMLEVKIYDLSLISKILDDSLNSGVNTIYNLEFSLKEEDKAREQVMTKALSSLENKVEHIKDNLDKKDYKLRNLKVHDNLNRNTVYLQNMKNNLTEKSLNSTNIKPSKIKISVTIQGEYVLIN